LFALVATHEGMRSFSGKKGKRRPQKLQTLVFSLDIINLNLYPLSAFKKINTHIPNTQLFF